jgi:hypothetical protein
MKVSEAAQKFITNIWRREPEKSVFEQQKEIIDRAERFDRLTRDPAWLEVLAFLAQRVNGTLIEATSHKYDTAKMMWEVVRWDSKRELLDDLQAHVNSTLEERDRIVSDIKEIQDAGPASGD